MKEQNEQNEQHKQFYNSYNQETEKKENFESYETQELSQDFLKELEQILMDTKCPECLMCGWCCKQTICFYGEWDYEKKQCKFLTTTNLCKKYAEINKIEDEMRLEVRLFGSGCCLNYVNPYRMEKLKKSKKL